MVFEVCSNSINIISIPFQTMGSRELLNYAVTLVLFMLSGSHGARILMIPVDHHSHVNLFANTGRALQSSGHDVYVLANIRHKAAVERSGLTAILIDAPSAPFLQGEKYDKFEDALIKNDALQQFSAARSIVGTVEDQVDIVLTSDLINTLRELQLDLAFVDGSGFAQSLYVIPYKLGIRYITLTATHLPWLAGIPSLPSVEPVQIKYIPEESSFLERLEQLILSIMIHAMPHFLFYKSGLLAKHIPSSEIATVRELHDRSELWFVNLENICLDSPRISAPHYHFIGGVGVEPAKALPADIAEFISTSNAPQGVIVVTFGSLVKRVPRSILHKMLNALGRQHQRVIMRNDDDVPDNVPSNILIKRWLPQNDLLGHPNVKLFVTHGGQNGQLEALYHGVPMVVMPFAADQWNNGQRVMHKGYGEMVDPRDFTEDELYETVKNVANNPWYRENIQRCSKIFKALPDPKETIIRWTNHILEHGGDHLKPRSMKVPMWQFFMWDIWATVLIGVHLLIYVSVVCFRCCRRCCRPCCKRCCSCCCRRCCSKRSQKDKAD